MEFYLMDLAKFLTIVKERSDPWNYPSKAQLARQNRLLTILNMRALTRLKGRLRSQNLLLAMRCNLQLGKTDANIQLWSTVGKELPTSVYRDMAENIVANAFYAKNKMVDALNIYVRQGDMASIKLLYNTDSTIQLIRALQPTHSSSYALRWLVQRYVNDAQEAQDVSPYSGEPQPLRPEFKHEVQSFIAYADSIAAVPSEPLAQMWKTAAAWLTYLYGDAATAQKRIMEACQLPNTDGQTATTARIIRFYISTAQAQPSQAFDTYAAGEVQWLMERLKNNRTTYGQDMSFDADAAALHRIIYQQLAPFYKRHQHYGTYLRLMAALDRFRAEFPYDSNAFAISFNPQSIKENYWANHFMEGIDSLSTNEVIAAVTALEAPAVLPMDKLLAPYTPQNHSYLHDIVGTRLMAQGRWADAIDHLQQVTPAFVSRQNIATYMATRQPEVVIWEQRQRNYADERDTTLRFSIHPKLVFARTVNELEAKLPILNNEDRLPVLLRLANLYMQASYRGNCWFLTHYGWSVIDTVRVGEKDFVKTAVHYLDEGLQTATGTHRLAFLFGKVFCLDSGWRTWGTQSVGNIKLTHLTPQTESYRTMEQLYKLCRQMPAEIPSYISQCDDLKDWETLHRLAPPLFGVQR